jgi:hypothetical protein
METGLQLLEGGTEPAEDHRPAAPALDATGDAADPVVHVLDGVGGREGALEVLRDPQLLDREQLIEALAERLGGARVIGREASGQGLEAALRGLARGGGSRLSDAGCPDTIRGGAVI